MNDGDVEGKKRLRSASNSSLPVASMLPEDEFQDVRKLLQKAVKLSAAISEAEEELATIREALGVYASANDIKGFRFGMAGYEYRGWQRRSTLNKELLLSNGVTAGQIAASYKEGVPFLDHRIVIFDIE